MIGMKKQSISYTYEAISFQDNALTADVFVAFVISFILVFILVPAGT